MPDSIEPGTTDRSIVELLLVGGPATRLELQARLGVSRPTLSSAVTRLLNRGLVQEQGTAAYGTGRNGRPQTLLAPNMAAGAAVGIELGKAQVAVTILAMDGTVHAQKVTSTLPEVSLQRRLGIALGSVHTFIASDVLNPGSVLGIGLGVAGRHPTSRPDGDSGSVDPPGVKLDRLGRLLPAPIIWDNNTRMAALRYLGSSGPESPNACVLYVVLSSGVSAGIIEGGQVFRGRGAAGELGHICIDPIGHVCSCGAKGCLEAYIGVEAAVQCARGKGLAVEDLKALADLVQSGDAVALAVSRQIGRSLGIGLSSAVMLIDPLRIILTGPLLSLGPALVSAASEELRFRRRAVNLEVPDIVAEVGSPFDSSHGAALSALQRWGDTFLGGPTSHS
ncbi:ROK family protein [Pseudarthrobacter sp. AL07]|uniref:ROK family transcriptional regulator n=1 Tax=unclassified Pseudarthrobacter TaxID=2647000 RepID=UPI00249C1233|nr:MULTISPECIES: ROK family transcriptional regulator [unclassified Pseudarthrobacter]MDI3193856.1 ROK family protein [Pseudarthrobacter sp. AL20]MDI3207634.1 ROK family protein [Pseudarthrobacter sp. AL07]